MNNKNRKTTKYLIGMFGFKFDKSIKNGFNLSNDFVTIFSFVDLLPNQLNSHHEKTTFLLRFNALFSDYIYQL